MKKILLLFAVLFVGTNLFAQDVKYGLKGGVSIANLGGDDPQGDAKTSFYIGGFVTFDIDDTFQFQPELVYSEQGSKAEAGNYEEKFKANYLNIPLVFKAKMFGTEKFKTVFGPQIGIMVKSELSSDSPMGDVDMKEVTKDLDVALALGLEYDFDDNFSINARYNWGVTKIFDQDKLETDARNSVFHIGFAYKF